MDKKVNLVFVSDESSRRVVLEILKKYKNQKFCYVGLDKTCFYLKDYFKKNGIDVEKFYFVDGISAVIKEPEKTKFCEFVSAPYDLKGIGNGIRSAISRGYNFIIFDSLSDLLAYGIAVPAGLGILKRFIGSFRKKLGKGKAFFICNIKDHGKSLIGESIPSFDSVKQEI